MNDAERLAAALLETEKWDKLHKGLEGIQTQANQADAVWRQLNASIRAKERSPAVYQQMATLNSQVAAAREKLRHARYAVAYQRSLNQMGLKPEDVENKYYGWCLGRGRCIVAVRGPACGHVNLKTPVPISEALNIVSRVLLEMRVADMVPPPPLVKLKPTTEWTRLPHIIQRMRERIPGTMPPTAKKADWDERIREVGQHLGLFRVGTVPIHVLNSAEWQMPLPYGYRLIGFGDEARSFTEGANAQPLVDNPYLSDIDYTHWRVDYPNGRPSTLPIPGKPTLLTPQKRPHLR
jgi:hypothetical protein